MSRALSVCHPRRPSIWVMELNLPYLCRSQGKTHKQATQPYLYAMPIFPRRLRSTYRELAHLPLKALIGIRVNDFSTGFTAMPRSGKGSLKRWSDPSEVTIPLFCCRLGAVNLLRFNLPP